MTTSAEIRQRVQQARKVAYSSTDPDVDIVDVISDALNSREGSSSELASQTGLSAPTISRLQDNVKPYNPQARTITLVCRGLGIKLTASNTPLTPIRRHE